MRLTVLLCVLMCLFSGCRKKSSPEFFKLDSDQSILVARDGDDAYVSDEMTAILTGLDAVGPDTLEKPRAEALAAKLRAEQHRVTVERTPVARPPEVDPWAGRKSQLEPAAEPPPAVAEQIADAGEGEPLAGMPEAEFLSRWGKCFARGPAEVLTDGGAASAQVLADSAACQKRHGTPGAATTFLFTSAGFWGKRLTRVVVVDAGPPPTPVAAVDAGEAPPPVRLLPGAPMPEGYKKSTPPE